MWNFNKINNTFSFFFFRKWNELRNMWIYCVRIRSRTCLIYFQFLRRKQIFVKIFHVFISCVCVRAFMSGWHESKPYKLATKSTRSIFMSHLNLRWICKWKSYSRAICPSFFNWKKEVFTFDWWCYDPIVENCVRSLECLAFVCYSRGKFPLAPVPPHSFALRRWKMHRIFHLAPSSFSCGIQSNPIQELIRFANGNVLSTRQSELFLCVDFLSQSFMIRKNRVKFLDGT